MGIIQNRDRLKDLEHQKQVCLTVACQVPCVHILCLPILDCLRKTLFYPCDPVSLTWHWGIKACLQAEDKNGKPVPGSQVDSLSLTHLVLKDDTSLAGFPEESCVSHGSPPPVHTHSS